MPIPPRPLPSHLGCQFSVATALETGLTPRRMRAADLTTPFRGARRTRADIAEEQRDAAEDTAPLAQTRSTMRRVRSTALSYLQVMPEGSFICGRSAAAIRGYPVTAGDDLDVGTVAPQRAPRAKGVRGRKVEAHLVEVELLDGIPVSSPATTWAMLARELSVRQLVIVGDAIVQIPRDRYGTAQPGLQQASVEDLHHAVDAGRRVGVKKLRAALELVRVGSASPLETRYRLDAADAGLPSPELDVEIRDARGTRLGISEFAYRRYRVIVEIEGDHHRTSKNQWNRDLQKYRDYANAGWEVVRLTASDIMRTRTATRIVREVLLRHGWHPAS